MLYNQYCPIKRVSVKDAVSHKPWLTTSLLNACKKKNHLYTEFIKTKYTKKLEKYKRYQNKLTSIIRHSEKLYYNNSLVKHKNNIRSMWSVINKVIKKSKSVSNYKNEIADKLNNFFVNVGPNLAQNIKVGNKNIDVLQYMNNRNQLSMFLKSTDETEIKKIVNNFKSKTSTGYDDIDMCLVKKVIDYITVPLSKIFNLSFQQGIFPDRMKIAKVIPLFKAGQKDVFTNYRPVSLLPQFSKILEKLFCVRLDNFIDKCNILCENQYGFRSGRSTSLAIIDLIENITDMLDSKKNTIGIFIDLKKAFDTIDHVLLLNKLEYYGVRGIVNDWFVWKQFVLLDDIKSSLLAVLCGVPHGSILSINQSVVQVLNLHINGF